jgi:hypothetical protein
MISTGPLRCQVEVSSEKDCRPVEKFKWVLEETNHTEELWKFGFAPYESFYSRVTKRKSALPTPGFNLQTHWKSRGFVILELPLEEQSVKNHSDHNPTAFLSSEAFKSISTAALKEIDGAKLDKTTCFVILIHARMPSAKAEHVSIWQGFVDSLEERGYPLIVFGGHEHLRQNIKDRRRLTIVGGAAHQNQTSGLQTLPRVGFIKLINVGTQRLGCEVRYIVHELQDNGRPGWRVDPACNRFQLGSDAPHDWERREHFSS